MKPFYALGVCFLCVPLVFGEETPVKSTLRSVGLFKNGVVVVQEEIDVPGGGRFFFEQVPVPIHGTFFLESDAVVETTITQRNVFEPLDEGQTLDYQRDLAGRKVRVYFSDEKMEPVRGVVGTIPDADPNRIVPRSRVYAQDPVMMQFRLRPVIAGPPQTLILETETGQTLLTGMPIVRVDVDGKIDKVLRKRSVMIFDVKSDKPAKIRLYYLTKGITWMPSYRIDVTDPKRLTIEQTAVVVNDLRQLKDTEVSLISGFSKIECENVDAPFSPGQTLHTFFQQLANRSRAAAPAVMTQQTFRSAGGTQEDDLSAVGVAGEGPDVHFLNVGKRSMEIGDSLSLSNGKESADYERIVEWTTPDWRDPWGRYAGSENKLPKDTEPWDMLRFRNPLPFPMTTAPATIVAAGEFYGQNTSFWAAPNEMTRIPVTKTLNVRVHATEYERHENDPAQRQYIQLQGQNFRRAIIDVELTIVNRRVEPVRMLVNRRFSGELTQPLEDAKVHVLTDDLRGVNRKHEIQWEFTLQSGEMRKWNYAYSVLIRN